MIPQVGGFQGCYLDNHRNNWRCARAVRKRPLGLCGRTHCIATTHSFLSTLFPLCTLHKPTNRGGGSGGPSSGCLLLHEPIFFFKISDSPIAFAPPLLPNVCHCLFWSLERWPQARARACHRPESVTSLPCVPGFAGSITIGQSHPGLMQKLREFQDLCDAYVVADALLTELVDHVISDVLPASPLQDHLPRALSGTETSADTNDSQSFLQWSKKIMGGGE